MRIHDFIASCLKTILMFAEHNERGNFISRHLQNMHVLLCYANFMLFQFYFIPILCYSNNTNVEYTFQIAVRQSFVKKHLIFGNTKQRK